MYTIIIPNEFKKVRANDEWILVAGVNFQPQQAPRESIHSAMDINSKWLELVVSIDRPNPVTALKPEINCCQSLLINLYLPISSLFYKDVWSILHYIVWRSSSQQTLLVLNRARWSPCYSFSYLKIHGCTNVTMCKYIFTSYYNLL